MSDECKCPHPTPGSALELATRGASTRVGARLSTQAAKALVNYCSANGCNQSEGLRRALVVLAATTKSPDEQKFEALLEVLDLDGSATREAILNAVDALLGASVTPGSEALGDTAQSPEPGAVGLSAHELATAAKIPAGPKRSAFLKMRTAALTRSTEERLRRTRDKARK